MIVRARNQIFNCVVKAWRKLQLVYNNRSDELFFESISFEIMTQKKKIIVATTIKMHPRKQHGGYLKRIKYENVNFFELKPILLKLLSF